MPDPNSPRPISVERFQNEPNTDFSQEKNRDAMSTALEEVQQSFGTECPLVIGGKAFDSKARISSRNPSQKNEIVGTSSSATIDHAEKAIDAARKAWTHWRSESVEHRSQYIELIAQEMRAQRFELASWIVHECGKPWIEADAEVSEAIDFCNYYSLAMRDLSVPLQIDYSGEENSTSYRPRGVSVVIAPWNFPLAILTGMTVASLVTGNSVIMKPAEQSPVIAFKLFELAREAGLPEGVLNYLPGVGEEIGPALVGSPDVDLIAFTGSRNVGLSINELAAKANQNQYSVKRVIAEMGGKNAIIIDEDADLDEAVQGVIDSAFGYAGQKCSACSRVIVIGTAYDPFLERLSRACESLQVGPAADPSIDFGPVIDEDALERINDYIEIGKDECETLVSVDVGQLSKQGYYVGPHVFINADPEGRMFQDEIFGPVLSVTRAKNLDVALSLANRTDYALTGGIYSRSPSSLKRAREDFLVGNLYLNRKITGAIVQRHPFGGFRMSGIGTKAGGPDYLQQFLLSVSVSENTIRRGFAPPPDNENA